MDFVCPAWHSSIEDFFEEIPILAAQSVRAIEIGMRSPVFLEDTCHSEIEMVIRDLGRAGIKVNSVHAPFGPSVDLSSFDDNIHEQGVAAIIQAIEFTRMLDAKFLIVHASHGDISDDRAKRLDRARGVIRELAVLAEASEITLAIENLPPQYLSAIPDETLRIVKGAASANVGVCFDTGHANLSNHFEDFAHQLLPKTVTAHIHDNLGLLDEHLFPGEGSIDWALYGNLIRELCPKAPQMIECKPPEDWDWPRAFIHLNELLSPQK